MSQSGSRPLIEDGASASTRWPTLFEGAWSKMTPELAFECLLISPDAGLRYTMSEVLHNFSIVMENCLTASKACDIIPERNPDLVVIDWDGDASSSLLHTIWNSAHRRKPTILGVSGDARPIPGAHFVLRKPVTTRSATE